MRMKRRLDRLKEGPMPLAAQCKIVVNLQLGKRERERAKVRDIHG
jgi:hypothetical protein